MITQGRQALNESNRHAGRPYMEDGEIFKVNLTGTNPQKVPIMIPEAMRISWTLRTLTRLRQTLLRGTPPFVLTRRDNLLRRAKAEARQKIS